MTELSLEELKLKVAELVSAIYYEGGTTVEELLEEKSDLIEGFNELSYYLESKHSSDKKEAIKAAGFVMAPAGNWLVRVCW